MHSGFSNFLARLGIGHGDFLHEWILELGSESLVHEILCSCCIPDWVTGSVVSMLILKRLKSNMWNRLH